MYFAVTVLCYSIVTTNLVSATQNVPNCGCHTMRPCYKTMLEQLLDRDEAACVEDAEISPIAIRIYLTALKQYCNDVIDINEGGKTFDGRSLYEVVISANQSAPRHGPEGRQNDAKPVIIIDAGQRSGENPVKFATYLIEQLTACMEYDKMIQNVEWVIMPCTNPDGFDISRMMSKKWYKNHRLLDDKIASGVDISRNFDFHWASCHPSPKFFSQEYPGDKASSENETMFVKSVLKKHKSNAKAYVSLRRDGHAILYPYGYAKSKPLQDTRIAEVAGRISAKINQRAGGVQLFSNKSIYEMNGKGHCGNSIDYAYDFGIQLAYEMRVYFGEDTRILTMFQPLPLGYESSLHNGYFSGIRELYNVVNELTTKANTRVRSKHRDHKFKSKNKL